MRLASNMLRVGGGWAGGDGGKRRGEEPALGLLPPFLSSHSSLLKKRPGSHTGLLPLSSAICSPAPSYPEKFALGSSPVSALFPHRTHSTKQHLKWADIQEISSHCLIFMSSFILHLFKYCLPITVGSVMWQLNTGEDHLDSSWVPPLRLCMTLNKLSRLSNLRAASYRGGRQYPLLGLWWGTNQSFFTMLAKPSCII